jgi:hypothetical protein
VSRKSLISSADAVVRSIISLSYLSTFAFMLAAVGAILKIVTSERLFNKGVGDA